MEISKKLSAVIKRTAGIRPAGTAVTDTAKAEAGTVAGADISDGDETETEENSRRHTDEGSHPASSNAGDSGSVEAKSSKPTKGLMVPPPPPAPCVLPPAFGPKAQASPQDQNQSAVPENTPEQPTAASGKTEAGQSAARTAADKEREAADKEREAADKELEAADKEIEAAARSWAVTVDKWKR